MMMKNAVRACFALVMVSMVAACSSDDSDSGGGSYSLPERSATCKDWQKAECDWLVDTCKAGLDRASCDEQFGALFCKSDTTMQSCTDALAGATCGTTPDKCKDVADPAPAVEYCKAFVTAICKRSSACGQSEGNCQASGESALKCSTAVGVKATAEQCLADVPKMDCENPELPASCTGVVLTLSGTASADVHVPQQSWNLDLTPAVRIRTF